MLTRRIVAYGAALTMALFLAFPSHAERAPTHPPSTVQLGYILAKRAGIIGDEWRCLRSLWSRESGWRVHADNPTSDAYGIPQALPGSKMGRGWRTSPYVQIRWGIRYVKVRYGGACAADSFQRRNGWY